MITQLVREYTRGKSDKLGSTWNPSVVMSPLVHESSLGFTLVQAIANSPLSATINGKIMTGFWHGKELSEDVYDEREVE